MSNLNDEFVQAQKDVVSLAERPDNATLLKLYALYKQATEGDAGVDAPGGFDLVAKKKHEAWKKLSGVSMTDAQKDYIAEVQRLLTE